MTTRVRIQPVSYTKLRQMADESCVPMSSILAEAIDALYRVRFLDKCNLDYIRLKANAKAWKQELHERRLWDVTLNDGLEST